MNKFYKLKSAAKIGSLVCALVVIDLTFPIASAMAAPLTYDYTVKIKAGPLAGDIFAGTFIVDSASVASGQGNVSNLTLNVPGDSHYSVRGDLRLGADGDFRSRRKLGYT